MIYLPRMQLFPRGQSFFSCATITCMRSLESPNFSPNAWQALPVACRSLEADLLGA